MNRFGLTIAVPRGALLRETLDLLDRIGVDTAEVRANDRKLLFADALAGLRDVLDLLAPAVAERVIFDLGLARGLGYYSGAVFDVYDPALGAPLGGGGRYDDLLGRFGRSLPAVGFALGVDRLHAALSGEEHAGL